MIKDKFLRLGDVEEATGFKRTKIYSLIRKGQFPAPVRLMGSKRASRWRLSEIGEWIDQQIALRDTAAA